MCGFAGFISYSGSSSLKSLESMCTTISHRGPDSQGFKLFESDEFSLGLGHRRLSIIDLTDDGKQPMHYKQFTLIFNGEIYNYKEIKEKLISLKHSFISNSDTEVLLHAYEEWGSSCVEMFIGMFSFALYDQAAQSLILIRDRTGIKPLFYYWDGATFLFGSEIKTFHQHPAFKKEINLSAVQSFMNLGYVPSPQSIFKNVAKLGPGEILSFDLLSKHFSIKKYWDVEEFYKRPKIDIAYEDAKSETLKLLKSACNYRMVSDVPIGVFLSGGYDSTLVSSILQVSTSERIKTFTIGVDNNRLNEADFAKEIASVLGTDHNELYCTSAEMLELVDSLPYYFDEPFGDSSAIPTMLVSKLASKHVTVALSADGGDEVFAGYNRYDYLKKLQMLKVFSLPVLREGVVAGLSLASKFRQNATIHRLKKLVKDPTPSNLATILNTVYQEEELQKLFKTPVTDYKLHSLDSLEIEDDLSAMLAFDYKTYLVDDILQKVDRATMSASIEGREPLLDHRIVEWVAQLPNHFKYNKGVKKFMLKDIVHDYIPKEIMQRPKMGFAVPVLDWLKNELKPHLDHYLGEEFIVKQDIFRFEQVQDIRNSTMSGKDKSYQKVWYLLMFQMWYERWM